MKYQALFKILVCLGLLLAVGKAIDAAALPDAEQAGLLLEPADVQTMVGTAITYQGHLVKNGAPVNATCDFQFALFDAASNGNFLSESGGTLKVVDGDFSIVLDFGKGAFQGDERWMQIYVRCPTTVGSYTVLGGRVALTAAPYAHSLRPGAVVSGGVENGAVFQSVNSADGGVAVLGEATSSDTTSDYIAYGGKFSSSSRGGIGVYGENKDSGYYSGGYGVYGLSNSTWGYGVYGENNSEDGYGVYGKNTSWDGYGVYSQGNAHVQGYLSWRPQTSFISVSAAAFQPSMNTWNFRNSGYLLETLDTYSSGTDFYADVQLPHGATVTGMSFSARDYSTVYNAVCVLYRNARDGYNTAPMATASSSGSEGLSTGHDTSIDLSVVDNSLYAYYLKWSLYLSPGGGAADGISVVIEYTINGPY